MKYNGKYSLTENLVKGRGMGLLSEKKVHGLNDATIFPAKTQTINGTLVGPGTPYPYSNPAGLPRKSGSSNASSQVGWNTGCDLAEHLVTLGFDIEYIEGVNKGPDVIASKGGQSYNFELGTAGKVTQMGSYNLDGSERDGNEGIQNKRTRMKDALVATGVVADITGATSHLASIEEIGPEIQRAYWEGAGDDFLVYKSQDGKFYAMALTNRAHACMPDIPFWDDLEKAKKIPTSKIVGAGSVTAIDPETKEKVTVGTRSGWLPMGKQKNDQKWKDAFGDRYTEI